MLRYSPNQKGSIRILVGNSSVSVRNAYQYNDSTGKPLASLVKVLKSKNGTISTRLGYEFHLNSGRHQIYYGADLSYTYYSYNTKPITVVPYNVTDIALNPFVGVKYRILERLSASVEITGSIYRNVVKTKSLVASTEAKDKSHGFSFNPLRVINVSYHF